SAAFFSIFAFAAVYCFSQFSFFFSSVPALSRQAVFLSSRLMAFLAGFFSMAFFSSVFFSWVAGAVVVCATALPIVPGRKAVLTNRAVTFLMRSHLLSILGVHIATKPFVAKCLQYVSADPRVKPNRPLRPAREAGLG